MTALSAYCCGARCRHCDHWRTEPPTAFCTACRATTYVDDKGACVACANKPISETQTTEKRQ